MNSVSPRISVIVPTLGRPAALEAAIGSVFAQQVGETVELIVVDNDPVGSALALCEALKPAAPIPLKYVHAPDPGVSNARNAGVANASGAFIAFLDDDETAPPDWLARLSDTQARFDADVVFGPVRAALPASARRHRPFLERFFSRQGPAESRLIDDFHGCGNSLIRSGTLPHPTAPFATSRNIIGGEDDLLFQAMQARGARFAWAADAVVIEHVTEARARLSYALRRAFVFGQGPASRCAAAGPRRWPMIPVWMAVGVGQALAYGVLALAQTAVRVDGAATLDRAAQGFGKLLWFPPFKVALYGRVPASPPQSPA